MSTLCLKKGVEFYAIVPNEPNKLSRVQVQVKWTKPSTGWVKLNTDGTMYGNPIKVSGGGVLRSSYGDWLAGFARKLGSTSSTMAELWALKDGLTVAKQMGIENIFAVMVDDDSGEVKGAEIPRFEIKVTHEAKLNEILHKINSIEIKLCSDGVKDFIKLLKVEILMQVNAGAAFSLFLKQPPFHVPFPAIMNIGGP
nr:putative ribonuclease h protein [Quercus suber]